MKTLNWQLTLHLKYPIKESKIEEINEDLSRVLARWMARNEHLTDEVAQAPLRCPGRRLDDVIDLIDDV